MAHPEDRLEELLTALGSDRAVGRAAVRDQLSQDQSVRDPSVRDGSVRDGSPEHGGAGSVDDVPLGRHRHRSRAGLETRTPPDPVDRSGAVRPDPPGIPSDQVSPSDRRAPVPLFTLPVSLRSAHVRVHAPAVWGMVLVVVVVAAVLGVRVAWAERQATPQPLPVQTVAEEGAPIPPTALVPMTPGPMTPAPTAPVEGGHHTGDVVVPTTPDLVVHVIGAVANPGVVRLPPGSRVQDAVDQAGGAVSDAELTRINLARSLLDGERIWVPVSGEEPPEDVGGPGPAASGSSSGVPSPGLTGPGTGGNPGAGPPGQAPVDLNTADAALLDTLPGVGPVTAESILAWRSQHGRFSTVEELLEVKGIGERTLEELRPHLSVVP